MRVPTGALRQRVALGLTLVALGTGLLSGCGGSSTAAAPADPTEQLSAITDFQVLPGTKAAPSGTVQEAGGGTWSYADPGAGKLTLLYFGYTSCPDVCPLTMADVASALTRVPAEVRDQVQVQFVTTDPHRDTPRQISTWLGRYSADFRGGRAPIAQTVAAARTYGAFIKAPKITRGDYRVTHGAQLFVLDPQGHAVGYFSELASPAVYAQALPLLVQAHV